MRAIALLALTAAVALLSAAPPAPPPEVVKNPPAGMQPSDVLHGPAILVQLEADKPASPLAISRAEIRVTISGCLTQTTQLLTFKNDTDRVLEGEFIFPLPEGATLSGYGLDIDGMIVDGIPVERHEARIAYEKEVRKGVDPGLAEWTKGNNFRTRVYPIPAKGARTVKVAYISDLAPSEKAQSLYHLPLAFTDKLESFKLDIAVTGASGKPVLKSADPALGKLAFKETDGRLVAILAGEQIQPTGELTLAFPDANRQSVQIENDESGKETYFLINDYPAVPKWIEQLKPVQRIGIAWDASLSRDAADKTRELALIVSQLGTVDVDLVVFRDKPETPVEFAIRDGKADALLAHLKAITYDGGTDLSKLQFPKSPASLFPDRHYEKTPAHFDYWLLFTDGLSTLGGDFPAVMEAPVYTVTGATSANYQLLKHIAQKTGGWFINLNKPAPEAGNPFRAPTYCLMKIEADPKQVADLYPNVAEPVQGRVMVTGRLLAPEATVTLCYGYPSLSDKVSARVPVTLKQSDAVAAGGIVPRFWAQQKVNDLALFEDKNHDELLALGRKFNLVTPSTSLLVLESLEQYLTYNITPPVQRKELRDKFIAEAEQREAAKKKTREEKINQVVALWEQKVKWWETEFKYEPKFVWKEPTPSTQPARSSLQTATNEARLLREPVPPTGRDREIILGTRRGGTATPPADGEHEGYTLTAAGGAVNANFNISGRTDDQRTNGPVIEVKPWDPKTPYLEAIKKAADPYTAYLDHRKTFGASPAFYLDCAQWFFDNKQPQLGIRILTNIVELKLEDPRLLRIVAHRLQQLGDTAPAPGSLDLAIDLFEKILKLRPEEPQSYRDLALALAQRCDQEFKSRAGERMYADGDRALSLLKEVIEKPWDGRFPEIELIANLEAMRLNQLPALYSYQRPFSVRWDPRLSKLLDTDIRILLTWDADATDIDLWVVEPSGETCMYNHNRTTIGGAISKDFTNGYGPEEYLIHKAMPGKYTIKANFYGSRQQALSGPTTVQATVITNFGRPNEKRQAMTLRLADIKETVEIGAITFEK